MSNNLAFTNDESLSDDGAELIQRLEQTRGARCASCGCVLCAHQTLISIALGFGRAPRCLQCTAKGLEQSPDQLVQRMFGYFQDRACYWAAWKWAGQQEAFEPGEIPPCLGGQREGSRVTF